MMVITISSILLYLCAYAAVATESSPRSETEGTHEDYGINTIKSETSDEGNHVDESDQEYDYNESTEPPKDNLLETEKDGNFSNAPDEGNHVDESDPEYDYNESTEPPKDNLLKTEKDGNFSNAPDERNHVDGSDQEYDYNESTEPPKDNLLKTEKDGNFSNASDESNYELDELFEKYNESTNPLKDDSLKTEKDGNFSSGTPRMTNSIDEPDQCYNLIDVFSPIVNFYELFLNFKPNSKEENPSYRPSNPSFNFTDISISMNKSNNNISFAYHDAAGVQIWMPLKDPIILKGRITYNENGDPKRTYSTSFSLAYHENFINATMLQNDTLKFHLFTNDTKMQTNMGAVQGNGNLQTLAHIDNTLMEEISKYSENFKMWVGSIFEKILTKNLAGYSRLENSVKMLKIPSNRTVCLHEKKLQWKSKAIDFISLKRFRKIKFITMHENANHTNTKNSVCNASDVNRMYDCQTFQMFHQFDLLIKDLEGVVRLCHQKRKRCVNLTFVGDAKILGIAATTAIKIKNVNFRPKTCKPFLFCSFFGKILKNSPDFFLISFEDLFGPLKQTDDHTSVAKWLADG